MREIAAPKNDYNLNLPRYIDSTEPEDLQDIEGHLRGGIPERDLDALGDYWKIMPALRRIYQHLMDYWAETTQDDAYLISAVGWTESARPHEIRQGKNKEGKLVWPEKED